MFDAGVPIYARLTGAAGPETFVAVKVLDDHSVAVANGAYTTIELGRYPVGTTVGQATWAEAAGKVTPYNKSSAVSGTGTVTW